MTPHEENIYYGRFNLGVVSLNLPYIAYEAGQNINKFYEVLDKYCKLAFKAHMSRVNNLKKATSNAAPLMWQHGILARLEPGESIEKLFYDNYATISLGYMGLYETTQLLTGLSHTDPRANNFAKKILEKLNEYCAEWRFKTNISFSLYGTPSESLTDKFSRSIRETFDANFRRWVTNSFHVDVTEEIDAFEKLKIESEFQALSPGGQISYVEVSGNIHKNPEALLALVKYIYETIGYAECNLKLSYCHVCNTEGDVEVVHNQTTDELEFECPVCGNRDTASGSLETVVRVCGYLGSAQRGFNQGRMHDIANRVIHL